MFYVCCRVNFLQYQPQSNKARKKQNNTFTFLNISSVQIYLIRFLSRYDGIKLNHIAAIDRKFRACGVFCVSDEIPYRVGNIRPFRNRVTVTRRALAFFIFKIRRAVVNGESPVSNSGLDSIYDKKRPSDKPNFSVQLGSLSRFTLFRNCKERGNVLTHTCGLFVLPCDGIAIVRTRKLLFSKCKSPQSRHRDAARNNLFVSIVQARRRQR